MKNFERQYEITPEITPAQDQDPQDIRASLVREAIGQEVIIQTQADLEQLAIKLLDQTDEGKLLKEKIDASRKAGREDTSAIKNRNKLWRDLCIEISLITGVEIDEVEHHNQRDAYRKHLIDTISRIDRNADDETILTELGMIKPAAQGTNRVFVFPSRIMPPYIKEMWDRYIGIVEQSNYAADKIRQGLITQEDFNGIDVIRTQAHNSLSHAISEILEFPGWNLDQYRNLVAKMRDEKFAKPSGEMQNYASLFHSKRPEYQSEHLSILTRVIRTTESRED